MMTSPVDSSLCNLWAASASRSTMTGIAPSAVAVRMIAAPMPLAPPVTRTTLFLSWRSNFAQKNSSPQFVGARQGLAYPLGDAHASGARDSLNVAVFGVLD